jgi:hypothetical protein
MITPLIGFVPDADWTVAGAITDCQNLIPTERGMAAAPSLSDGVSGLAALPAECKGAAVLVDTLGTRRVLAGTQTLLYQLTGATWSGIGGPYTGSTDNRWSFTQLGNASIASNNVQAIQAAVGGPFSAIAAAPKAKIVIASKDFVLAFDTDDATNGRQSDRWWCSGYQNHTLWTPSVATQATTGRLVGVSGSITAAAMLGGYAVAYKERGAYVGQYVGAPVVWQWDAVPAEFGCVGQEAIVDIGGAHFLVGPDNIWLFDGTRPIPVAPTEIRQFFFADSSAGNRYKTIVSYDRQNSRVWIHYVSSNGSMIDSALVYHLISKRWGRAKYSIEAALSFASPGVTIDTLPYATYDLLPEAGYDSPFWQSGARAQAVFDLSHALKTLTGTPGDSGLTTGDYGDDWNSSYVRAVTLRFLTKPANSSVVGLTRDIQGGSLSEEERADFSDNMYCIRQDARWHRFVFSFTGSVELTGISIDIKKAGSR